METINTVIFYILSAICVASAVFCLFQKNTMNAVISAIVFFFGVSGLYFLLKAPYLGAAQIFLTAGAGAVFALFCNMVIDDKKIETEQEKISLKSVAAPVIGLLFALILVPFILYGFSGLKTPVQHTMQDFATVLYKNNILSFELAGLLLFIVIIGVSAIFANKINKIKATRLVKTPESSAKTSKEEV